MSLPAVLEMAPAAAARAALGCVRRARFAPAEAEGVVGLLTRAVAGERGAWRAAAQTLAASPRLRVELDTVPGLRTRVWRDGAGGTYEAITALLIEFVRERTEAGMLIQRRDGRLWIPDTAVPELAYHLELDRRGIGWDFAEDLRLQELLASMSSNADERGGLARLWRGYLHWAGGASPLRAFLIHPGIVGGIPASGLAAHAPRLAALAAAVRATPVPAPILPVGSQAPLLGFCPSGLPSCRTLGALARSPGHAHLAAASDLSTVRAALSADPACALPALLARAGVRAPSLALVAILARLALLCSSVGAPGAGGIWEAAMAHTPPLPRLRIWLEGDRLWVGADGIAALARLLGLFPHRYMSDARGSCAWPWAALAACGWSALARHGRWQILPAALNGEPFMRMRLPPAEAAMARRHPLVALARAAPPRWLGAPDGACCASVNPEGATVPDLLAWAR